MAGGGWAIATNAVAVEVCSRCSPLSLNDHGDRSDHRRMVAVQASMNRRAYECQIAPPVVLFIPVAMMNLGAREAARHTLLFGCPSVRLNPPASSGILVLSVARAFMRVFKFVIVYLAARVVPS